MIKDSKLIGTKIKAPFGWKKFKVGDLFDCKPLNCPEIAGYTGYVKDDMVISPYGHTPYLAATSNNNGISGYSDLKANNKANVITLSTTADSANTVFYQEQEFIGRQQMEGLRLKSRVLTKDLAFYFIPFIKKQACLFNYGNKLTVNKLKNFIVIVPITVDNQPDFEWMSAYIKAVKTDYLEQKELSNRNEIEAYLSAGNVDSMDVTDADRQFLRDFANLPRRKFKVGELFVPTNPKRYDLKISDIIDNNGNTTVISSTTVNQGIKGYSSMAPLVKANKIVYSDAVGPSMMFYQECDFIADAHVKYLKPKFTVNMSKNTALYLITCIQKSTFGVYNYGNKYNNDAVNNTMVELPVIDSSQVDVQSIEKYMQIQSKPLINKVAETLAPVGNGH